MKIDQALIRSHSGTFGNASVSTEVAGSVRRVSEEQFPPGVIVKISTEISRESGGLRASGVSPASVFGSLATPQVFGSNQPAGLNRVEFSSAARRASGLATSRVSGDGALPTANKSTPLTPESVKLPARETPPQALNGERETRTSRGAALSDVQLGGAERSGAFVEIPTQAVLNGLERAPLVTDGASSRGLGPNPIRGEAAATIPSLSNVPRNPSIPSGSDTGNGESFASGVSIETDVAELTTVETNAEDELMQERTVAEVPTSMAELAEGRMSVSEGARESLEAEVNSSANAPETGELTQAEEEIVRELRQMDRRVREHEQAHMAAGGGLTGSASYSYTSGPDHVQYATGGEVSIDLSEGENPQETIRRAQIIQRAALAPGDPSPQDRSVAAKGARMEMAALAELREVVREEQQEVLEAQESSPLTREDEEFAPLTQNAVAEDGIPSLAGNEAIMGLGALETSGSSAVEVFQSFEGFQARSLDTSEIRGLQTPGAEAGSTQGNEALRPTLNTELFAQLQSMRSSLSSVEGHAGGSIRHASHYGMSNNAYQAREDTISVA